MLAPALAALVFCSGATALVFALVWVKLTLAVGAATVTTTASGFLAGLAAGGLVLGRRGDRTARPLALVAGLQGGAAITGLGVTLALGHLAPLDARLAAWLGPLAAAVPFLLVGAPAFLMGGTLPVALRAARPPAERTARVAGCLCAAHALGGAVGALAGGIVLVPALGVSGTGMVAAAVAAGTAAVAAGLGRLMAPPAAAAETAPAADAGLALGLSALAGAVALGCEVAWTQATLPILGGRATASGLVLVVSLAGAAVGSAICAPLAARLRRPWLAFGVLEILVGATVLAGLAALGPWLPDAQEMLSAAVRTRTGSAEAGLWGHMLPPPLALLLAPALLIGAAFPVAARLACGKGRVGGDVGALIAAGIAGGIAGTWLTASIAVPLLGLVRTLVVLAVAASAVGAAALGHGSAGRGGLWLGAAAVVALAVGGARVPRNRVAQAFLATHPGKEVSYEESAGGTVAVIEEPFFATSFRRLYVQGAPDADDGLMARRYLRLQALLPLLLHDGDSHAALVVGLGTGITCGTLLAYPDLERRVCVEPLPAVRRAVHIFAGNLSVDDDPRVEIRIADGRHDLLVHEDPYDLITVEPPAPVAAGVARLYAREFYTLCRTRLAPHGLMAQWIPLETQNDEETRMLVRSFLDVFPHVTLWSTEMHALLLVGSADPLVIDAGQIARRLAVPAVASALAEVGVPDVTALLATYVAERRGVELYAGDAPAVTDDRPRIESPSLLRPGTFAPTLAHVLQSRGDPDVVGGEDDLRQRVHESRERLLDFYQAAVYWSAGQPAQAEPLLRRVLEAEPQNPYFAWFVGR